MEWKIKTSTNLACKWTSTQPARAAFAIIFLLLALALPASDAYGDIDEAQMCLACHTEKLVHSLGMRGLSCLMCHNYPGKDFPGHAAPEKCTGCHTDRPEALPMAVVQCSSCHKPHGQVKPRSSHCLSECHVNENSVGRHGQHQSQANLVCLDCHKAHTWGIGQDQALGLCSLCHDMRSPELFTLY